MGWRGKWEGGSGLGTHVNPCLIHVNVWQKPLQYCKVISLQLIKTNGKKIVPFVFLLQLLLVKKSLTETLNFSNHLLIFLNNLLRENFGSTYFTKCCLSHSLKVSLSLSEGTRQAKALQQLVVPLNLKLSAVVFEKYNLLSTKLFIMLNPSRFLLN